MEFSAVSAGNPCPLVAIVMAICFLDILFT